MTARSAFPMLFTILLLTGCNPLQPGRNSREPAKTQEQMVFIGLKAVRAAGGEVTMNILTLQTAPGKLKKPAETQYLCPTRFELLASDNRVLSSGTIEHPLVERLEFSENNQDISVRIVRHDSREFMIRTAYFAQSHRLRIISDNPEYPIIHANLQLDK